MRERSKKYGFTILEMLLVVALIALLASVGGGIYVGTYKNMLAKKAVRDFLLGAKYARITAIERQNPCKLVIDADGRKFALFVNRLNAETGTTTAVMIRDLYFKPVEFASDVKFEKIQIESVGQEEALTGTERREIVFRPNGSADSVVLQIGDGQNRYTVTILAATGKAKVYEGDGKKVKTGTIDLDEEAGAEFGI